MTKNDDRPIGSVEKLTDRAHEDAPIIARNLHEMATNASRSIALRLAAMKTILEQAEIIRIHLKQEEIHALGTSLQAIAADYGSLNLRERQPGDILSMRRRRRKVA